jgi:hypothetical protein
VHVGLAFVTVWTLNNRTLVASFIAAAGLALVGLSHLLIGLDARGAIDAVLTVQSGFSLLRAIASAMNSLVEHAIQGDPLVTGGAVLWTVGDGGDDGWKPDDSQREAQQPLLQLPAPSSQSPPPQLDPSMSLQTPLLLQGARPADGSGDGTEMTAIPVTVAAVPAPALPATALPQRAASNDGTLDALLALPAVEKPADDTGSTREPTAAAAPGGPADGEEDFLALLEHALADRGPPLQRQPKAKRPHSHASAAATASIYKDLVAAYNRGEGRRGSPQPSFSSSGEDEALADEGEPFAL